LHRSIRGSGLNAALEGPGTLRRQRHLIDLDLKHRHAAPLGAQSDRGIVGAAIVGAIHARLHSYDPLQAQALLHHRIVLEQGIGRGRPASRAWAPGPSVRMARIGGSA
jgi:hypothetical protein